MRHEYELSRETIKVLNGKGSKVAEEMHVDASYISQILGKTATDPFAKFAFLFDSADRAGCDVDVWITKLQQIKAKNRSRLNLSTEKEAAEFVESSANLTISIVRNEPPHTRLTKIVNAERELEDLKRSTIEEINTEHGLPEIRQKMRVAVNGR